VFAPSSWKIRALAVSITALLSELDFVYKSTFCDEFSTFGLCSWSVHYFISDKGAAENMKFLVLLIFGLCSWIISLVTGGTAENLKFLCYLIWYVCACTEGDLYSLCRVERKEGKKKRVGYIQMVLICWLTHVKIQEDAPCCWWPSALLPINRRLFHL
jgi:uncharacterized membrane protein